MLANFIPRAPQLLGEKCGGLFLVMRKLGRGVEVFVDAEQGRNLGFDERIRLLRHGGMGYSAPQKNDQEQFHTHLRSLAFREMSLAKPGWRQG